MAGSSKCALRAEASFIVCSQCCRWYRTGELPQGNLRRQCSPGLSSEAFRHRVSVRSLTPSRSRASRAVAHGPTRPSDWVVMVGPSGWLISCNRRITPRMPRRLGGGPVTTRQGVVAQGPPVRTVCARRSALGRFCAHFAHNCR